MNVCIKAGRERPEYIMASEADNVPSLRLIVKSLCLLALFNSVPLQIDLPLLAKRYSIKIKKGFYIRVSLPHFLLVKAYPLRAVLNCLFVGYTITGCKYRSLCLNIPYIEKKIFYIKKTSISGESLLASLIPVKLFMNGRSVCF